MQLYPQTLKGPKRAILFSAIAAAFILSLAVARLAENGAEAQGDPRMGTAARIVLVLLLGAAAVVIAARYPQLPRVEIGIAIATVLLLWLPLVLTARNTVHDGERFWVLSDDAMISMRYARNLASGLGLVWNAGEQVEGFTNLGWTLYMSLVHRLPLPIAQMSLVILLTNVALAVVSVPAVLELVRALGGGRAAGALALLAIVLSLDTLAYAASGLETILLALAFTLATTRVLREAEAQEPKVATYFLIASLGIIRADAIVLSGLLYLCALALCSRRREGLLYTAMSLSLLIANETWRIWYYGDVLPNTAYLKTMNWDGRIAAGLGYVLDFFKAYAAPLAGTGLGALLPRARPFRALAAALLVYAGYVAWIGGDAFPFARFFVPVLPPLMALAFVSLEKLFAVSWARGVVGLAIAASIPLLRPVPMSELSLPREEAGNVEIGLYLKENTLPTTRVADFYAGTVLYFSERPGIDLLGKTDKHIARVTAFPGGTKPGHNKFDLAYSLGELKPDIVVANFKVPVTEHQMELLAVGDYAFTGQLFFDPHFRKACFPNPLPTDTWRTLFTCHWSP